MGVSNLAITINAVDFRTKTRSADLSLHDVLNAAPNMASGTVDGTAPVAGQNIVIGLNTVSAADRIFAGTIQTVEQVYEGRMTNIAWKFTAVDYTFLLNRRRPFGTWTGVSATTIVQSLVTDFAAGFTSTNVQASLPSVSVNFDGSEGFSSALNQLARLVGGYWYVDVDKDVHFFQTETSAAPDALDSSNTTLLHDPPITYSADISQIRTRVYGKGHGEVTLTAVAAGATSMPVSNASAWFNVAGGQVQSGTQVLTYTGVSAIYIPPLVNQVVQTPSNTIAWSRVVWADSLGLFVAVAASATSSAVSTSPDGVTWTARTPSTNKAWQGLAWSPDLSLLVAVAATGEIMTSPDGITWTTRTSPEANAWGGVCWAPAPLSLFVMVGGTGTNRVQTSSDGITWTSQTAASALNWQDVVWSPELELLAASATNTTNAVMTSPDGVTWTTRAVTLTATSGITWSPSLGLFAVVATNEVFTSPDGITWTARTAANANAWTRVTWIADLGAFMAVADTGANRRIMSSTDGIVWVDHATPVAGAWRSIAWSPELHMTVTVGQTGSTAYIMTNTVQQYPVLTGIPPSGAGSIAVPLIQGAPVNIWVQRDDTTAQTAMATLEGGDGIHEFYVSDERRGLTSLTARCDAELELFKDPIVTVTYATRDIKTKSGKTIHVDLPAPTSLSGDFTIQDVTISEIDIAPNTMPRYTVTASSVRFSLEDVFRRAILGHE